MERKIDTKIPKFLGKYRDVNTAIKGIKGFSREGRRKLVGLNIFTFKDIFDRLTKEEFLHIQGVGIQTANLVQIVAWEKNIKWGDKKPIPPKMFQESKLLESK